MLAASLLLPPGASGGDCSERGPSMAASIAGGGTAGSGSRDVLSVSGRGGREKDGQESGGGTRTGKAWRMHIMSAAVNRLLRCLLYKEQTTLFNLEAVQSFAIYCEWGRGRDDGSRDNSASCIQLQAQKI